jgi:hypothetical protein
MIREAAPEVRLYQAAICQAFIDACVSDPDPVPPLEHFLAKSNGNRATALSALRVARFTVGQVLADRREAREWLLSDSEDFRDVCDYADLDADNILEQAKRLAALNWPQLNSNDTHAGVMSLAA